MSTRVPFLLVIDVTQQRTDEVFTSVLNGLTQQVVDVARSVGWLPTRIAIGDVADDEVSAAYDRADAIVIMGGEDVDPSLYGMDLDYPESGNIVPLADRRTTELVRQCVADRTPLFGICRGLQLINVALGGTLVQHLENAEGHRKTGDDAHEFVSHEVEIASSTALREVLGASNVRTESSHHQAADVLGSDLRVAALAPDGTVEAIEHTSAPVLAVQWHPESLGSDPGQLERLLRGLMQVMRKPDISEGNVGQAEVVA